MSHWYDRAYEELENQLWNEEITPKEFHQAVRELREEYEDARREEAQEAYDNY